MKDDSLELLPEVAAVGRALRFNAERGVLSIAQADMEVLVGQLLRSSAEPHDVATHLVALALKVERLAGAQGESAIAQIGLLLAVVIGGSARAAKQLANAGVGDQARMHELIGTAASKTPVSASGRVAGAFSPLGLRMRPPVSA